MSSIRILGISGSLRKNSFNTALLREAKRLVEGDADVGEIRLDVMTLHGIPLYDGDVESEHGEPESVAVLKGKIQDYDAIIFSTPEYNNGIPGVFKNAIDWLSRPSEAGKNIFSGRHIAVMGASPGGFGTVMAQSGWLPVLKSLGVQNWSGGRLLASKAHDLFDTEGAIADDRFRDQLIGFVQAFSQCVRAEK